MLLSALERWIRMPHPNFQLETESWSATVLLSYWKRGKSNKWSRSWELTPNILTHFFCLVSEQQKKANDKIEADSAIYAELTEPTKKSSDKQIYDTPATPGKPIGQEPQVIEASGFFNPLYQTRQDVMQFPDISSIFATPSPPPDKQLAHEPGESSC